MAAPPSSEPGFMDTLKGYANKAASAVTSLVPKTAATDSDELRKSLALPQEAAGRTITGGRRYRKKTSKRHSKKRKTMRRRH